MRRYPSRGTHHVAQKETLSTYALDAKASVPSTIYILFLFLVTCTTGDASASTIAICDAIYANCMESHMASHIWAQRFAGLASRDNVSDVRIRAFVADGSKYPTARRKLARFTAEVYGHERRKNKLSTFRTYNANISTLRTINYTKKLRLNEYVIGAGILGRQILLPTYPNSMEKRQRYRLN